MANLTPRVPNKKEIKKEVYCILLFLKNENLITSIQYKTLKGHARRNQFEHVFNFLRKYHPEDFMYLAKFMTIKSLHGMDKLISEVDL